MAVTTQVGIGIATLTGVVATTAQERPMPPLDLAARVVLLEERLTRQERLTCRLITCVKALWLALSLGVGLAFAFLLSRVMQYLVLPLD